MMNTDSWFEDRKKEGLTSIHIGGDKKMKTFPKAGKGGVKTTTVMFVPSSKGGLLTKMMKEREDVLVDMTRFRIKIQEAGGVKLKNMFSTDLAAGDHCSREDCMPCKESDRRQNCKRQSIL